MQRTIQRHFLDTRRPTGLTMGGRIQTQLPVICEADIIGVTYGTDAVTDPSRVTCPDCRRRLTWAPILPERSTIDVR